MAITVRVKKRLGVPVSLYLDICHEGRRKYEFLDIKLKPQKSLIEREHNKEMREYAKAIAAKRWNEILADIHGMEVRKKQAINFFDFADKQLNGHRVYDRGFTGAIARLKEFAKKPVLYTSDITEKYLSQFYDYLEENLNGETPGTYFKKIKQILREATKQKLFIENPASDIKSRKFESTQKETLSPEEIKILFHTRCPNSEVKAAFLFCCLTGLRFCDVKGLTSKNVQGDKLSLIQKKTRIRILGVLNKNAQQLVGNRVRTDGLVFRLPSHTGCLKSLRKWLELAGIEKHVGWHNARHSFGTNLIHSGADIYTTSKLLGHASLKHTERYLRESDKLKEEAVNKLPNIF